MDNTFTNEEREFDDDQKNDLLDRGFTDEQIEYLETLDLTGEHKYSNICKDMDDYDSTPEEVIELINSQYNAESEEDNELEGDINRPSQGGKRRKQNKTRRRKQSKTRRRKQSKTRRRKQNKTRRRR